MASLLSPVQDFLRGFRAYPRGVRWLTAHPRYLALLIVPVLVGLVFLIGAFSVFVDHSDQLLAWVLFARPESGWWHIALYYVAKVLLYVGMVVLTLLGSVLLMNVAASPVYERISIAIEREITGIEPPPRGAGAVLRVMFVELRKVCLIYGVSILLLLIPGVNVLSTLSAAFFVGWDFFDYPLARRGWTLRQRLGLVTREFWAVLGLGLWLVIPFAQFLMMPLAVAGGTLLNLEALRERQLLILSTNHGARE